MSNTSPRIVHLKSLLALVEKRAVLQREIDELHGQITTVRNQLFDESPAAAVAHTPARKVVAKGRAQRGALKAQILAALETAGHTGVRVTELAESLGTKAANLHAWFHATAKRIPSIVKVAGGHYRLNGHGHPSPAPRPPGSQRKTAKGRKLRQAKARRA